MTAPINDDIANASVLTGTSASDTGTNVDATIQTGLGEPTYYNHSVWWKWTAPANGQVTINLAGSNFFAEIDLYTGTLTDAITETGWIGWSLTGIIDTFAVSSGAVYWIKISGFGVSDVGNISISLSSGAMPAPPANDDIANAITLTGVTVSTTGNNRGATREAGETATNGDSVWWKWTPATDGWVTIKTYGSNFDTFLRVHNTTISDALAYINVVDTSDDVSYPTDLTSKVTFYALTGVLYHISVQGSGSWDHGSIVLSVIQTVSTARWHDGAHIGYDENANCEPAWDGFGSIYIAGSKQTTNVSEFARYDIATDTWFPLTPIPSFYRFYGGSAVYGGKVYVFAGSERANGVSEGGSSTNWATRIYDIATDSWSIASDMPGAGTSSHSPSPANRTMPRSLVIGDKIYLVSGFDSQNPGPHSAQGAGQDRTDVYDPKTDTWQALANMPLGAEFPGACVDGQGRIHVFGGNIEAYGLNPSGFPAQFQAHQVYTPSTDTWAVYNNIPNPDELGRYTEIQQCVAIYMEATDDILLFPLENDNHIWGTEFATPKVWSYVFRYNVGLNTWSSDGALGSIPDIDAIGPNGIRVAEWSLDYMGAGRSSIGTASERLAIFLGHTIFNPASTGDNPEILWIGLAPVPVVLEVLTAGWVAPRWIEQRGAKEIEHFNNRKVLKSSSVQLGPR